LALAFITVKNDAVIGANQYIPVIPDREAFTAVLDDTDNGVKDLFTNVNSHVFSEIMGAKPYISATYDGSNVKGMLVNGTATASNDFYSWSIVSSRYCGRSIHVSNSVTSCCIRPTFNAEYSCGWISVYLHGDCRKEQ
jgi:hypothetical protein